MPDGLAVFVPPATGASITIIRAAALAAGAKPGLPANVMTVASGSTAATLSITVDAAASPAPARSPRTFTTVTESAE